MLFDGFDHYTDLLTYYDEAWGAYYNGSWYTSTPTIGAWGRCGTQGVKFSYTEAGFRKALPDYQTEYMIGMAVRCLAATKHYLFVLEDITDVLLYAYIDSAGYLHVCTGYPGESTEDELGVTAAPVTAMNGIWHQIECYIKLNNGAGEVEVRVDGNTSPVLDLDTLNTLGIYTSSSGANSIVIGSEKWIAVMFGQGTERYMDDLVVRPNANTFIGDVRSILRVPTGPGTFSEFTPSDSGANWEMVDENPPNEIDGVSSSTVGNRDTYAHAALPANTQSVLAVAVIHYTKKADAGVRKIAALLDIAGSLNVGSDVVPSLGSYQHFQQVWEGPYTKAQADVCEFGVKITA